MFLQTCLEPRKRSFLRAMRSRVSQQTWQKKSSKDNSKNTLLNKFLPSRYTFWMTVRLSVNTSKVKLLAVVKTFGFRSSNVLNLVCLNKSSDGFIKNTSASKEVFFMSEIAWLSASDYQMDICIHRVRGENHRAY